MHLLGAGGMGEVYRARDTRLDRVVAVKISRERFSERFEHEARTVASLNHPHICTLHDVGPDYLVMEYIEGAPLKGPLPLAQALEYAAQICDALAAAHQKGIIHRDLKPANILLTKSGIKLLDFGLAKTATTAVPPADATLTMALTGKNEIVGTLYYMSPEQLQAQGDGRQIDARADIFSFGIVLYEMLTGKRAFEGSSPASVIAAIMERPAPSIAAVAPLALDRAFGKCLAKDPDDRWQTARDLKDELTWIGSGTAESLSRTSAPPSRIRWALAAAVLLTIAVIVLSLLLVRARPEQAEQVRFQVFLPEKLRRSFVSAPILSPNGEWLVASVDAGNGNSGLWLRPLNGLEIQRIPGTEDAETAFWSPDSRSIAFTADGQLKRIDLAGGLPRTLCDLKRSVRGGAWNREGIILLGGLDSTIVRVSAQGGELQPVTKLNTSRGDTGHTSPVFLPDQRRFLYHADGTAPELRIASLDGSDESNLPIATYPVAYAPPGYVIFGRGNTLVAQRFDPKGHLLVGEPFPVAEQVAEGRPNFYGFSVSTNGVLAWRRRASAGLNELAWFDRTGNRLGAVGEPADYSNPALSPDEKRLAVSRRDPSTKTRDIWLFDLVRGVGSRFTFDPADDTNPVWSPDGAKIAFTSNRKGKRDLYWKNSNGTGEEELILASTLDKNAEYWSPDGKLLLFNMQPNSMASRAALMSLEMPPDRNAKPAQVIASSSNHQKVEFSPDGKFIVYWSNESQKYEVYVQNFPPAGGKWQVSVAGGNDPHWRGDGKEIFYRQDNQLMAAPARTNGASFEAGVSRRLFEVRVPSGGRNAFAVSRDGQRFLVNTFVAEDVNSLPIIVLVNWTPRMNP
jgi:serine/threonine protein kinase/Tol biopolymer transport system component